MRKRREARQGRKKVLQRRRSSSSSRRLPGVLPGSGRRLSAPSSGVVWTAAQPDPPRLLRRHLQRATSFPPPGSFSPVCGGEPRTRGWRRRRRGGASSGGGGGSHGTHSCPHRLGAALHRQAAAGAGPTIRGLVGVASSPAAPSSSSSGSDLPHLAKRGGGGEPLGSAGPITRLRAALGQALPHLHPES